MKTVIVACRTLEDELNFAMKKADVSYPVEWLASGLHNTPQKLKTQLQENLDSIEADCVLLGMAFCGNAILGIKAKNFRLIVPRVDDCISLLLGSPKKRLEISKKYAAYFLTDGWMRGERNIWVEYQYVLKKYGKELAASISKMMYGHYRTLALLSSGVSPVEPLVESTKIIADTLNMKQEIIPASTDYIQELLLGPWTKDRFILKAPNSEITAQDLTLEL